MNRWLSPAIIFIACSVVGSGAIAQKQLPEGMSDDDENPISSNEQIENPQLAALCEKALSLISTNQLLAAKALLDKGQTIDFSSPKLKRTYGYLYLASNQPEITLSLMRNLQLKTKATEADRILEGYAHWKLNEVSLAELSFKEATILAPDDENASFIYIRSLLANQKWANADNEIARALTRFRKPESVRLFSAFKLRSSAGKTKSADASFSAPPTIEILTPILRRSTGG